MSQKKVKVDVRADKQSVSSRMALAGVVANQMSKSAFIQDHPKVQDACVVLVTLGKDLGAAAAAVNDARVALVQAEGVFARKIDAYDAAHAVCVAQIEHDAQRPEDITSAGFSVFRRESHDLAAPLAIEARFDAGKDLVRITVKHAPGMTACVTEISADPSDPTKWQRLPGMGARHAVGGYAPGTYWVRAASMRASEQSAFTGPIPVVVR